MTVNFNQRGYIEPASRVSINLTTFQHYFVESFPSSATRATLFNGYTDYINDLNREVSTEFIQWVGGSFTSQKTNPKDLDLVTILPFETFNKKSELIEKKFRIESKQVYGIDAYFISFYPESHRKYALFKANMLYWDHLFSQTRKNRKGKRIPRGYIQIAQQMELL